MDKKSILKIVIQSLIYILGLIGAYLGVTTLSSCTASSSLSSYGAATIITVDTTYVEHDGYIRPKNYYFYERKK